MKPAGTGPATPGGRSPIPRSGLLAIGASVLSLACNPGAGKVAYVGGTVWDGTGAAPIADAVVLVASDSIERVGPADIVRIPRGAEIRRLDGKWVIPGLIDAHVSLERWMLRPMLAYGVTAVRDAGGDQDSIAALRDELSLGGTLGPRPYIAGAAIDLAPPGRPTDQGVRTPVEARRAVDNRREALDASHVMTSPRITRPVLQAILDEARLLRLKVGAHLGRVDAVTAAQDGVAAIEHLSGIVEASVSNPGGYVQAHRDFDGGWAMVLTGWARLDSARLEQTAAALAATEVILVPTLFHQEAFGHLADDAYVAQLDLSPVTQEITDGWDIPGLIGRVGLSVRDFNAFRQGYPSQELFVRRFRALGGRVAAGSGSPDPLMAPGASLHEELKRLVRAGLEPRDALLAATRDAAWLLDADSLGQIRDGSTADFVVLGGSPLEDIDNVDRIELVVFRGTPYTPGELRGPR